MSAEFDTKVRLSDLPVVKSLDLPVEFVRDAIADMPLRRALERRDDDPDAGTGKAELELYPENENVHGRGTLRGWCEIACGRCVTPVRVEFDEKLSATFMPKTLVPTDDDYDAETELAAEDVDVFAYEGEYIDVGQLLREQLILSIPYAPLCSDGCKGLCPSCGADLNDSKCDCKPPIDPRLAALQDMKL